VVVLSGEADLTTVAQLSEALTAQISARARHLTVDLSEPCDPQQKLAQPIPVRHRVTVLAERQGGSPDRTDHPDDHLGPCIRGRKRHGELDDAVRGDLVRDRIRRVDQGRDRVVLGEVRPCEGMYASLAGGLGEHAEQFGGQAGVAPAGVTAMATSAVPSCPAGS
jgi:hypothetical protein